MKQATSFRMDNESNFNRFGYKEVREGNFYCVGCFKEKPVEEAVRNYNEANNTGECRKCKSDMNIYRSMRNKVQERPGDYMECNDCDRYFPKYSGRVNSFGRRRLKIMCPYCKSEEIDDVPVEQML